MSHGVRRLLPLAAVLAVAAVTIGGGGAMWAEGRTSAPAPGPRGASSVQAPARDAVSPVTSMPEREAEVSRDSARAPLARPPLVQAGAAPGAAPGVAPNAAELQLRAQVEQRAAARSKALVQLADAAAAQAAEIEANRWTMPLANYVFTSGYGYRWGRTHAGLDLAAPSGTPLVALGHGTVTSASYDGGYGNKIVLTLEDGTDVWYCHMTSFAASSGETVRAGEVIGYVGSTGSSTGPHLHLEIHPGGGDAVDPEPVLAAKGLAP